MKKIIGREPCLQPIDEFGNMMKILNRIYEKPDQWALTWKRPLFLPLDL